MDTAATRNPWIAGLLSFVWPGLGHAYVGRAGRGLAILLAATIALLALGAAHQLGQARGLVLGMIIGVGSYLFLLIDAVRLAGQGKYRASWYNRWWGYGVFALLLLLVGELLEEARPVLGYMTRHVPSGSMAPIIQKDDTVLIDTHAFRSEPPRVGDIVVFNLGSHGLHIRRVVSTSNQGVFLQNEARSEREFGPIPVSAVVGRVTGIVMSRTDLTRIGTHVQ